MGRLLTRAVNAAGLAELAERALLGAGLGHSELDRLRREDILLVAGIADSVRAKFHDDEVRIVTTQAARDGAAMLVHAQVGEGPHATGADFLREVALTRLATPASRSVAVSVESVGLELAQTALLFGANELHADLGGKRTLPLLDGPEARRVEISGLCERAGRTVRFVERQEVESAPTQAESRG
jgi:hypothetical protein